MMVETGGNGPSVLDKELRVYSSPSQLQTRPSKEAEDVKPIFTSTVEDPDDPRSGQDFDIGGIESNSYQDRGGMFNIKNIFEGSAVTESEKVAAKAVRLGAEGLQSELVLLTKDDMKDLSSLKMRNTTESADIELKEFTVNDLTGMRMDQQTLDHIRATMLTSARRRHESETMLRLQEKASKDKVKNRFRGAKLTKSTRRLPERSSVSKNFDIVLIG